MKNISTFSIVARDPHTGELGVAVQSKFLAAAAVVSWAKAGAGAIATQAMANLDYGELGLKLLEKGYTAQQTLDALLSLDDGREDRQVGIVDADGNSVAYTGGSCFDWAGHITGDNFSCQGNILVSEATVKAMAEAFNNTKGNLATRLVEALDKAQEAGGDKRGRQSAGLLIVKENGSYGGYNDKYIDLRVDDDPEPIKKLRHLLYLHELYFNKPTKEDIIEVTVEVGKRIQDALKRLEYYNGDINGLFDQLTQNAYFAFCGVENFEERLCEGSYIDKNVLNILIEKSEE
ncbi:DUF1028 domain-containing protein [Alkaliphilus peptidifermentans]|nr:DUF1028 domain-containing protein [Alkaliphilus peptidifermentans]